MEDSDGEGSGGAVKPFTVIQQRPCALVRAAALCETMDLVAVLFHDGALALHRTMSWERVLSKSADDLVDAPNNVPTSLCFNHNGKVLGFGCDHGEVSVLCVETSESQSAHKVGSSSSSSSYGISSLVWLRTEDRKNQNFEDDGTCVAAWSGGGTDLAARAGMNEHNESGLAESKDKCRLEALLTFAESSVLLALSTDRKLIAYAFGVFPTFSIDLGSLSLPSHSSLSLSSSGASYCLTSGISLCAVFTEPDGATSCSTLLLRSDALSSTKSYWLEQSAKIFLIVLADLGRLHDMVSGLGKKWKEATRVVLGKLGLLQGALDSYELKMSAAEFLHSTAMCGAWHPAATAAFSQHWNEQGLTRLRSAVDLASKAAIKQLHLRAIPIATNISLRCRELIAVSDATSGPLLQGFLAESEALLLKLDAALAEARLARDAMLLFLQFVKESCAAAAASDKAAAAAKIDIAMLRSAQRVLDPRLFRAPWTGKDAQAEHVSGSHLYAYLQDAELPAEVAAQRSAALGLQRLPRDAALGGVLLDELRALAADMDAAACAPAARCRRSLLQQIKVMRERWSEAARSCHAEKSALLATALSLQPSAPQRSPHGPACATLLASLQINGGQCLINCLVRAYALASHMVSVVASDGNGCSFAALLRLPYAAAQLQLYVREEGSAQQEVHLLGTGDDESGSGVLFKIDLCGAAFSAAAASAPLDLSALSLSSPAQPMAGCTMRVGSPSWLVCSGGRGVALLGDVPAGRVMLVDVETEAE